VEGVLGDLLKAPRLMAAADNPVMHC